MEIAAIIISIVAFIVSTSVAMWGWWRHRNIYGIEFEYIDQATYKDKPAKFPLKRKLNSGEYTILNSYYDSPHYTVVLGKIKK
ncbi:MAG: hypothetical protein Q7K16_02350 [Candidatus Azambacteria bacterium]|nr:hypothetical protein [Candidatus Azambacteria bacterium]